MWFWWMLESVYNKVNFTPPKTPTNNYWIDLNNTLAGLQTTFQLLCQMRNNMAQFHHIDIKSWQNNFLNHIITSLNIHNYSCIFLQVPPPPPHFLATLMKYYTAKDIKWYLKKLTRGVLTYFFILICQFLCLLYMALAGHSGYVCEDAFFMFSSTVWANKIYNQFIN